MEPIFNFTSDSRRLILAIMMMTLACFGITAQVTTSSVSGQVTESNGDPLIGVAVEAVYQPSGTRYSASTNLDGYYAIDGMRSGGPYVITYSYVGMQ